MKSTHRPRTEINTFLSNPEGNMKEYAVCVRYFTISILYLQIIWSYILLYTTHRSSVYAHACTSRTRLCVRAEAGDRSGQGTERCWGGMCVYVWNFGGVDMKSLQLRIAATKSEEEAGIDGGCVLKETWCKLPVLSRSKEEQIFWRLLCYFPQYHLSRGLPSYLGTI